MSGASGAYPQKMKRKRYSTESGVMDHVPMTGTLEPIAQEAGRGDEGAGVYGGDAYYDRSEEEEEEEEERRVKKRKGPPVGSTCRELGCDKWAVSGGLCKKHGGSSKKPCLVEGCDKKARSDCAGRCKRHFKEKN